MVDKRSFIPRLCGLLAAVLGLELVAGWLLGIEAMVRILPSSNSVSFNTAVAFVLAGTALAARSLRWRQIVGSILAVVATAVLFEDLFDVALGLDWESLHRAIQDGSPRPGRAAPNTCASLILIGALLHPGGIPGSLRRNWLTSAALLGLVVLIVGGIAGQLLDPTLMYGWYKFNRMAAPTAFGLGLLTLGLFFEHRALMDRRPLSTAQRQKSILISATLILLAMGMAGTVTTAIIFANHQQETIRDKLQSELTGQSKLAEFMVVQSAAAHGSLDTHPLLRGLIQRAGQHQAPADLAQIRGAMDRLLHQGYSGLSVQWTDGSPPVSAGATGEPVDLAIPLAQPAGSALMWHHQGFVYRAVTDIASPAGRVVARVTTEQPLPALSSIYEPLHGFAASADTLVCGRRGADRVCFPSRLNPSVTVLPPPEPRGRRPLDDALDGLSGVRTTADLQGGTAVVAFTPLGATGLVVLSKVDALEIYKPINYLLTRSLAVLAVSLAVGVLLMRKTVGPLVSAIARSESRAVDSERRLKSITDNVPALIGFVDKDLRYRFMNATYERWFGKPVQAMLGRTPQDVLGKASYERSLPLMQQALAGETVTFTHESRRANGGHPKYLAISYIPDRTDDGEVLGFNVLAFDTTERHQHEAALSHLAHHDSLTGLPNRRLFADRLSQAMERAHRHRELVALFYLDIDHFKQINDTHGHEQGDLLLSLVARRLTEAVRSSDTVARLGGDEFIVLMGDLTSKEDAVAVAEKILRAMRAPCDVKAGPRHVTVSIGLAYSSGGDGEASDRLLQQSDAALYEAKAAGRNRCHVSPEAVRTPLVSDTIHILGGD